jgi:hypothetical protein
MPDKSLWYLEKLRGPELIGDAVDVHLLGHHEIVLKIGRGI